MSSGPAETGLDQYSADELCESGVKGSLATGLFSQRPLVPLPAPVKAKSKLSQMGEELEREGERGLVAFSPFWRRGELTATMSSLAFKQSQV